MLQVGFCEESDVRWTFTRWIADGVATEFGVIEKTLLQPASEAAIPI